ncbi:SLATT domain-containing protein [Lapidilactobacillus dextrinicus]|uniref:SLATT domain-containing protein n=1 Tax=Lapidilactobacillus dextrinicus TaxID=51664 RepID=UPI003F29B812
MAGEKMTNTYRRNLMIQLRESYGKLTYTYTAHNKMANRMDIERKRVARIKIVLSAVSTVGLVSVLGVNQFCLKLITTLVSATLLALTLYYKDTDVIQAISEHRKAANDLWNYREAYLSLMTDFDKYSDDELSVKRDTLTSAVGKIYSTTPRTDQKSYRATQKALKDEEEQFFTPDEIDKMLPEHLRMVNIKRILESKDDLGN